MVLFKIRSVLIECLRKLFFVKKKYINVIKLKIFNLITKIKIRENLCRRLNQGAKKKSSSFIIRLRASAACVHVSVHCGQLTFASLMMIDEETGIGPTCSNSLNSVNSFDLVLLSGPIS